MDPLSAQISTSAVVVAIIEWLKEAKVLPWINKESSTINRLTGIFFALIAGLGLSYMYDPTSGVLTVTGLQWSHIGTTVWATFQSYGMQWLIYKGVFKANGTSGTVPPPAAATGGIIPGTTTVVEHKENPLYKV